jgi:hypothetical protein
MDKGHKYTHTKLRKNKIYHWYVSNSAIRNDLQIATVKEKISRFSSHYNVRFTVHPNELIASLTEPPASILAPRPVCLILATCINCISCIYCTHMYNFCALCLYFQLNPHKALPSFNIVSLTYPIKHASSNSNFNHL